MADPLARVALEIAADLVRPMLPMEAQTVVLARLEAAGYGAAFLRLNGNALHWEYKPAYLTPAILGVLQQKLNVLPVSLMPLSLDSSPILRETLASCSSRYLDLEKVYPEGEGSTEVWKTSARVMRAMGIRRGIEIPVVHDGRALGLLVVWADALTPHDCEAAGSLGSILGAALARPFSSLDAYPTPRDALRTLQSVIATLPVDQPIEQSLAVIREAMLQALPDLISPVFALRDPETDEWDWKRYFPAGVMGKIGAELGGSNDIPLSLLGSGVWATLLAGKPVLTTDAADLAVDFVAPEASRKLQAAFGIRAIAAFPLAHAGQVLGLLFVGTRNEAWSQEEQDLLSACASSIALAVANARLYERQRHMLRLMMQVPVSAGSFMLAASAPQRLQTIVDESIALFDADAGALWAVRDGGADIKTLAYRGLSARYVQLICEGGPHAAFKRAMELRVPTRVNVTYARDDTEDVRAAVEQEGIRSVVASPLLAGNTLRGVLALFRKRPAPFSDETLAGVHVFSRFSALAYQSMRLTENSDRRLAEVEVLRQILQALVGHQDMKSIGRTIGEHACRLTDSDSSAFYLWDPARQRLVLQAGTYHGEPLDRAAILEPGEGLSGTVFETKAVVRLDDYYTWPRSLDFVKRKAVGPALGVPVHLGGEVIGALGIMRDIPKPSYDDEDVELVEALADEVAVSVAQARLGAERDRQHEFTQRILDANPSILLVCDAGTTNTILVNRRFLEITGWTREEVIGKPWLEQCVPLSWRSRLMEVAELLREEGGGFRFLNPILARDGCEIPVDWYNAIVRGEDGTPLYIVSNGILAEE